MMESSMITNIKSEPNEKEDERFLIKNEPVFDEFQYSHQFDARTSHYKNFIQPGKPLNPGLLEAVDPLGLSGEASTRQGPINFYCEFCFATFRDKEEYEHHVKNLCLDPSKAKPFICSLCNQHYSSTKSLKRHRMRIHNIEPPPGSMVHQCMFCDEKFCVKAHLKRHVTKHTGERAHFCNLCMKSFTRKEHLNRHLVCVHGSGSPKSATPRTNTDSRIEKRPASLDDTSSSLSAQEQTILHLQLSLTDLQVPGEQSAKSDYSNFSMNAINGHPASADASSVGQGYPECQICRKRFTSSTHLEEHMELHQKSFECPICLKRISRKDHLKRHMRNIHSESPILQEYSEKYELQMPLEPKFFECPICQRKLTRKDHLKRHMKNLHSDSANSRIFNCEFCSRHFTQEDHYSKHMLLHTDSGSKRESFMCEVCFCEYPSSWNLRKHKLHSHGIEPISGSLNCEFCHRKFIDKYSLNRHSAKHKLQGSGSSAQDNLVVSMSEGSDNEEIVV